VVHDSIGNEALFIETIFSPWTTARRLAGKDGLDRMRRDHPEIVLAAMSNIAISLAGYATEALRRGASGIFLSLGAATDDILTIDEYDRWCRPFDMKILAAAAGATFNVLHIHGKNIHFNSLLDYPVSAINWSHFFAGPSLNEGRRRSGKAVMGGIDETTAAHLSPKELRSQVMMSVSDSGTRSLLVTPGCSVPTDTPKANLIAITETVGDLNR
jgi:uroporphyrinogen decarboxylase